MSKVKWHSHCMQYCALCECSLTCICVQIYAFIFTFIAKVPCMYVVELTSIGNPKACTAVGKAALGNASVG